MISNFERGFADQMQKIAGGYSPLGALALGGLGAAAGALADRKKRRRGALIGGILGALGGTAIDLHDYLSSPSKRNTPGSASTAGNAADTPVNDNHTETSKPVAPKPEKRESKGETPFVIPSSKNKPDDRPSERKTYAQRQYEKERAAKEQELKDNPTRKVQVEGTGTGGYPKRYVYLPRSGEEEYENGKLPDPAPAKVTTEGEDLVPYKVRPGETLSSLSALGLDWMDDLTYDQSLDKSKPDRNAGRKWLAQDKWIKEVMLANPYLDPNKIQAGQTIYIPKDLYGGIRSRDFYEMDPDENLEALEKARADFIENEDTGTIAHPNTEKYVVGANEDLYNVCVKFGIEPGELRELNGIDPNNQKLHPGDVLIVPKKQKETVTGTKSSQNSVVKQPNGSKSYVVQPGDDIYSIALKLGVPPLTLRKTHEDGKFRVGETVIVQ
jgi:LysM repeat protein